MMKLSDIKTGMEIEYYSNFIRHGVMQGKNKRRKEKNTRSDVNCGKQSM